MRIRTATRNALIDEWKAIKEQPIPDCLCQFSLDWRDKTYRDSPFFPFAAKCKGMTLKEYGDFLDKKISNEKRIVKNTRK